MLTLRKSQDRGHADHGWLSSHHTFSFAGYYDPAEMGWGNLRVINEDRVAPAMGFGMHGHQNMEIISYVISGALAHRDSMGHETTLLAGQVQRMSAGHGVRHSEFNPAQDQTTHFFQIWIEPSIQGIAPSYAQDAFPEEAKQGKLLRIASPDGREGSLQIHADASMYAGCFGPGESATLVLLEARKAYVHLIRGTLRVNGVSLAAGDGLKLAGEKQISLDNGNNAEVLVFDLSA